MKDDNNPDVEALLDIAKNSEIAAVKQEADVILNGEQPEKGGDQEDDEPLGQSLSDYFSGNKEVMDLFLAFCFLIQRVNTGGLAIAELQVLNDITKKMVDDFGLDTEFLNYIVGSISDNKEIYRVFAKNSSELNIVQRQRPKRLCEIMTEHMPSDCGYRLELSLTGVLMDDLKRIESLLALIDKTHISELTSIENNYFSMKVVNPWSVLLADYGLGYSIGKNVVVTAFKHPVSKPSSVYLAKSLITVRRWLLRRIPKEESVVKKPVVERLSKFDAVLERERFLGITPTFLSLSANRPYRNKKLESRIVFISDVADQDEGEGEYYDEFDGAEDTYEQEEIAAPVGIMAKAKSFFGKVSKGKVKKLEEVEVIRDYEFVFVDYAGYEVVYNNLSWFLVDEDYEDTILRQYRQIFYGCAIGEPVNNNIDVSREISGKWMDAAIGYYMAVNYTIEVPDDESELEPEH